MALNKKFSAMEGLDFSTEPEQTPAPTKPVEEKTAIQVETKNNNRFDKTVIKKTETKSVRKQFLIRESDNEKIAAECKRLDISQNEFINLLIKRYFE